MGKKRKDRMKGRWKNRDLERERDKFEKKTKIERETEDRKVGKTEIRREKKMKK